MPADFEETLRMLEGLTTCLYFSQSFYMYISLLLKHKCPHFGSCSELNRSFDTNLMILASFSSQKLDVKSLLIGTDGNRKCSILLILAS